MFRRLPAGRKGRISLPGLVVAAALPCLSLAEDSRPPAGADAAQVDSIPRVDSIVELPATRTTAIHPSRRTATATQPEEALAGKALDRARGLSLGEALEALPGVTVLRTGATIAKPSIHGMQGDRIVVLNNGIRQEGQQWGSEHAPEVDPFLASRLVVVKGASSVRYGPDALGGAVLVEPWPLPAQPMLGGEAHLAGFSNTFGGAASATLEGGSRSVDGLGWRVQGSGRKAGDVATPDYRLNNTAVGENAFSAALGLTRPGGAWEIFYSRFRTDLGIFTGSHIGSLSDLEAALERRGPVVREPFSYATDRPRQDVTHHLAKARGSLPTGKRSTLGLTYALQHNVREEYDHRPLNDALAAKNTPELRYAITTHTLDFAWDHKPTPEILWSLGGNGTAQFNLYEGRPFIPNFRDLGGGVYSTIQMRAGAWEWEGGARCDYSFLRTYRRVSGEVVSGAHEYLNPSAMAGVGYRPSSAMGLKLHLSTAYRPPGVHEMYSEGLHHGAAAIELGDAGLRPERSFDLGLALDWQAGKRLRGGAGAFSNHVQDYIRLQPVLPATLTIRGAFPTFRYVQGDASFRGVDGWLRADVGGGLAYLAKGSLLRARDEERGGYLPMMPADRMEHGLEWEGRPGWAKGGIHAAFSVQTVLRQTHAPADSLDYAPPPEGYSLLRARLGVGFPHRLGAVDIDLEAVNLLDVRYRDYSNRFRYYADDPGRNIILRIKAPFGLSG